MFKEFLVPTIKYSEVFNRSTCPKFVDSMWDNMLEHGPTFGAVELWFKQKGFKLAQITYLLSEANSRTWCAVNGYPQPSNTLDEYWMSHAPGFFRRRFKSFALDKSHVGYTMEDVDMYLDKCKVSQKVKTQTREFCGHLLQNGAHVLCLGTALGRSGKVKVYSVPRRDKSFPNVSYKDIRKFAKFCGFDDTSLSALSSMEDYNLECLYTSVVVGKNGVEDSFSVELSSPSKEGYVHAIDYMTSLGLANETHVPKEQDIPSFHHVKLTFKKSKIIPKLYLYIGYAKFNPPKPRLANNRPPKRRS